MPIAFACECGKSFSVPDEFAGKRTKCPKCGAALTVPAPATSELSDEDKAFAALEDAPDEPPPAARASQRPAPSYDPPPAPPREPKIPGAVAEEPPPKRKRGPKFAAREGGREGYSGITISPTIIYGILMMIGAGVWFGLGYSAGRIYFYPPVLFVFGLITTVRGFFGYEPD
jgi:hypothetical protein